MDNRNFLQNGTELLFPGMTCTVEKCIGKGSNAVVYMCTYPDSLNAGIFHRVLVKELFPYHPKSLIYRNDDGNIVRDEALSYFDLQKLSFERGNSVHLQLLEKYPDKTGSNINTFSLNSTLYTIIGFDGGVSLDKLEKVTGIREIAGFMRLLLDALSVFHENGFLHLDISPDNILVTGKGEYTRVSLIDYNSVHRVDEIRDKNAFYSSMKEGFTAPEIVSGDITQVCEASDLYSVCAVFYRLITGSNLTLLQRVSKNPPDISECACLEKMPDTVKKQVAAILKKGLAVMPSRRYKSCSVMKKDIEELICRIDGIGITHAALWDAGRRNIMRLIRTNPAFSYLEDESGIYRLKFSSAHGSADFADIADMCIEKGSLQLFSAGGTGKTTTFLHIMRNQSSRYSADSPCFLYVSLYGASGDGNFIKNKILEDLKFDADVENIQDARRRLVKEFSRTRKTTAGEKPRYILLLDGLNEAADNVQLITKEILYLSNLPSVRIIVSSRSSSEELPFDAVETVPLEKNDIRMVLARHGLLYPASEEMQSLLSNPMMLSVFCKTAEINEKQILCKNEEELIALYLNTLCDKENRTFSGNDEKYWMTKAAVKLVLPFLCAKMNTKKGAISEEDVYKTVKKCYAVLSAGKLLSVFPGWTGHVREIKGGCKDAAEWYGVTVNRILRYNMGLIVKDTSGSYRIMHQNLEKYLLGEYKEINHRLRRKKSVVYASSALFVAVMLFVAVNLFGEDLYDRNLSDMYLEAVAASHVLTGRNISDMMSVSECFGNEKDDLRERIYLLSENMKQTKKLYASGQYSRGNIERIYGEMIKTGDVIYMTREEITEEDFSELFDLYEETAADYEEFLDIIRFFEGDSDLYGKYGEEFYLKLSARLEADASLADAMFYDSCVKHIEGIKELSPEKYGYYWDTVGKYADIGSTDPEKPDSAALARLRNERNEKTRELRSMEIFIIYERSVAE